jgi:metal-dependent HD superfamily phosphatase/phosphodiesterase
MANNTTPKTNGPLAVTPRTDKLDKLADDPRVRHREPGEETLKLEMGATEPALLSTSAVVAAREKSDPDRPIEFATPRVKLLQEADLAIRADLAMYPKALAAHDALSHDDEALANWDMANYITVRKLGYNDHGRVHAWVTGAASLAILELLVAAGVKPDVIESGAGDLDDTYVVVLLGTMLHDIGNQVHRAGHEAHGVTLALPILDRVLAPIYPDVTQRTKLRAFILHSIDCHDLNPPPLTLEGGVTAVADGTDITKGRGRKAFARGSVDIHSISALAIEQVTISRGLEKPVEISVAMNNSAGIFQVEETLARKVIRTPLEPFVSVTAITDAASDHDMRIVSKVALEDGRFVNLSKGVKADGPGKKLGNTFEGRDG